MEIGAGGGVALFEDGADLDAAAGAACGAGLDCTGAAGGGVLAALGAGVGLAKAGGATAGAAAGA